jgi:hypothetical protein
MAPENAVGVQGDVADWSEHVSSSAAAKSKLRLGMRAEHD